MSTFPLQGQLASPTKIAAVQAEAKARMEAAFPISQEGSYIQADNNGIPKPFRLVTLASITENATELANEKARTVSMADVFNNWYRFSHQTGTDAQPALPSELSSWSYDSGTDTIMSTLNSASILGFVSKKKYDQYTLEVEISSDNTDDDDVGLVAAFARDPVTGYENKLTAIRSPGGNSKSWFVGKNYQQKTGAKNLFSSDQIAYGNGGYGASATAAGYVANTAGQGWGSLGPTRIKIVRNGDIITFSTTEFGASYQTYKPSADFTVDLSADPALAIFRGPCAYGYTAESQQNALFKTLKFTGDQRYIFDLFNKQIWTQNADNSWSGSAVMTDLQMVQALSVWRIFHNPITGKTFHAGPDTVRRFM
jgi:hypothetical protein